MKKTPTTPTDTKGFALPLAIGIGLIILLVGFTMILRSSDEQVSSTIQKQSSNSFAIAEGGISRTLSLLNGNYQYLLKLSHNPINPKTGETYLKNSTGFPLNEWQTVTALPPCVEANTVSTELLQGTIGGSSVPNYQLLAYQYDTVNETGTLLLQGTETQSNAVSVIQQSMSIQDQSSANPVYFPGLLAEDIDLGNNDILGAVAGNVLCSDSTNCPVPNTPTNCIDGQVQRSALESAINADNNGVVQGQIYIRNLSSPPSLPTIPAINEDLGSISADTLLSPPNDNTDPYIYGVSDITLTNTQKLTINTSYRPIYLVLTGDITLAGNASIIHPGPSADFRIYGNPPNSDDSDNQQFLFNGGANATHMFVFAPDADAGINGGSSTPDILGAVWVKSWGKIGSNSNNVEIQVPDDMPTQLGASIGNFPIGQNTGALIQWEQRPAP